MQRKLYTTEKIKSRERLSVYSDKSIAETIKDIKFYLREFKLNHKYLDRPKIAEYCYLRALQKARGLMLLRRALHFNSQGGQS